MTTRCNAWNTWSNDCTIQLLEPISTYQWGTMTFIRENFNHKIWRYQIAKQAWKLNSIKIASRLLRDQCVKMNIHIDTSHESLYNWHHWLLLRLMISDEMWNVKSWLDVKCTISYYTYHRLLKGMSHASLIIDMITSGPLCVASWHYRSQRRFWLCRIFQCLHPLHSVHDTGTVVKSKGCGNKFLACIRYAFNDVYKTWYKDTTIWWDTSNLIPISSRQEDNSSPGNPDIPTLFTLCSWHIIVIVNPACIFL